MSIPITRDEFNKKFGHPPIIGGAQQEPQSQQPGYFQRVGQSLKGTAVGLGQDLETQAETIAGESLQEDPSRIKQAVALGRGGLRTAGATAKAALTPLVEAPGIKQAGEFVGEKLANTLPMQKFQEWSARHPEAAKDIENTLDIASLFGGKSASAPIGKGVSNVVETTGKAIQPTVEATGRVLKRAGEGAYGLTITPEEATTQALRKYNAKQPSLAARVKNLVLNEQPEGKPITEANTAARRGLMGTEKELGVQATRISNQLWKEEIQPKLAKVKGEVNMKTFLTSVEKEIASGTKGVRRTQLLESFKDIKDEFKNVSRINLEKLQEYKEDWTKFIPDSAYKGKTPGSALREVQNIMSNQARKVIYKYVGEEGKTAYRDYGNLQSIIKSADRSVKDLAKQSPSRGIWQFLMDKAVTPVATVSGKVLYRTGEGLEFVGKKGAKRVGDVID